MSYFLRELTHADLALINQWRNDREVQRWLVSPFRFVAGEVDERWFDRYLGSRGGNVRLAVCEADSEHAIGAVYLLGIDWIARCGELGIWIGNKAAQGKGAGEFATRGMLRHAFADLGLRRVGLHVLADNERALRLYRKVGFVEEGRLRLAAFKEGEWVDLVAMALLSHEYQHADSQVGI